MAKYNLNTPRVKELAEQAAAGFTLLPEGEHLMRCTGVTYKLFPAKDGKPEKDAWSLDLIVAPGESHEHETCRDTLFFSDKAMGRVLLCCSAFGCKDEELSSIDPEDEKCRNILVGRTAIVKVKHSKADEKGNVYANVDYAGYRSADGGKRDVSPAGGADMGVVPF